MVLKRSSNYHYVGYSQCRISPTLPPKKCLQGPP